ncbi:hypothetical protein CEXT_378851 [Caerostris extrusa]|uniref:Uncharacterized protein n=1 Tax=Caerostris extrusa TaxID=172846 RepID=A0AAV4WPI4_CAEEX|nr:hypothetical protein CEXT_378851 [Caerostris extrusa]
MTDGVSPPEIFFSCRDIPYAVAKPEAALGDLIRKRDCSNCIDETFFRTEFCPAAALVLHFRLLTLACLIIISNCCDLEWWAPEIFSNDSSAALAKRQVATMVPWKQALTGWVLTFYARGVVVSHGREQYAPQPPVPWTYGCGSGLQLLSDLKHAFVRLGKLLPCQPRVSV